MFCAMSQLQAAFNFNVTSQILFKPSKQRFVVVGCRFSVKIAKLKIFFIHKQLF
jgi:hypothetical protein